MAKAETEVPNRESLERELAGYKARAANPDVDDETAAMLSDRIALVEGILGIPSSSSSARPTSKAPRSRKSSS